MSLEALYPRRLGIQPRGWRVLLPEEATPPTPAGYDVADAGPGAGRVLSHARNPDFLEPAPLPLPRGSSWCPDEATLRWRIEQAEAWRAYLEDQPPSPLRTMELALTAKLTLQMGAASGWDVFPDGLGLPEAGDISRAASLIGRTLQERFGYVKPFASGIPRHTNSGAPAYGTSDPEKLLHALIARSAPTWDGQLETYHRLAGITGAPPAPAAITFSRTGPVAKWLTMYDWRSGSFTPVAEGLSVAPRRRAVFGVPSFINQTILPFANAVKYGVMRLPWSAHTTELALLDKILYALKTVGPKARIISDDISAFDLHVRRNHQQAICDTIYRRWWPTQVAEYWLNAQRMPVLGPPLHQPNRGFMYTRPFGGVTTSGIITTSLDGTLINLSRIVTSAAAALDTTVEDAYARLLEGRWAAFVWGDDTMMVVPPSFDLSAYTAANTELGYKTAPEEGAALLMKYYDPARVAAYPFGTRVLQQTWWNEHGGRTEAIELLGLYARTAGLEHNPYARRVWQLLLDGPKPYPATGYLDRNDIGQLLRTPGIRSDLDAAIGANPMIVREWERRAERGAPDAHATIEWAEHLLGRPLGATLNFNLSDTPPPKAASLAASLTEWLMRPSEEKGRVPPIVDALIQRSVSTE